MTTVESRQPEVEDEDKVVAEAAGRYRSERGNYEIYTAPELTPPRQVDEVTDEQVDEALGLFDWSNMVDAEHDDAAVRESVAEMIKAISPGNIVTPLFGQAGPNGMSLVHAWFAPHFPLFRHSHPKFGDCLYYVVAGSAILGSRVLKAGDGFFVPNGMPYKYRAGPEGVEVLEFRAGGGIDDQPALKLHESTMEHIQRITAAANDLHETWNQGPIPQHIADTANPPR
jgi:hypothetical protein